MKRILLLLSACLLVQNTLLFQAPNKVLAQAKNQKTNSAKIEGFVTKADSPNSFEIGDYKIRRQDSVALTVENQAQTTLQFKPENIRVGVELTVEGILDPATGELDAKKVTVDLDQFRKLTNTTVLSNYPFSVEKDGNGYRGSMWADGRRIRIEPTTKILFQLNKSERKAAQAAKDDKNKNVAAESDDADEAFADAAPLTELSDVKAGMIMTYEATGQPDGKVLASRVVFTKNELEPGERKLWQAMFVARKEADLAKGKPAEIKINGIGKFKLLPDDAVQNYVKQVGERLIPIYQKELPADDSQKIPFRFYVVLDKQPNSFSTANGIVVVNSGMIEMLENEAQLASVLAHEIAHATQEHSWRIMNKDRGKKVGLAAAGVAAEILFGGGFAFNLAMAAMMNKFSRRLENQADRIGLQYLTAAGYDPREAPRVWQLMGQKFGDKEIPVFTFLYATHSAPATRRSYLTVELGNNYTELEFDRMMRNETQYQPILKLTQDAVAAAKNKKKKNNDKPNEGN